MLARGLAAATGHPPVPRSLAVSSDDRTLWVSTDRGIWRFDTTSMVFSSFGPMQGLPPDGARGLALDREARLWAGTSRGAARFVEDRFQLVTAGLPSSNVLVILPTEAGPLFAGTDRGLARLDPSRETFVPIRENHEFTRQAVLAAAESPGDGTYFARERGFERRDPDGTFHIYQKDVLNPDRTSPLLGRFPRTLSISRSRSIWVVTERGIDILARANGIDHWQEIPFLTGAINPSGIPSADIEAIAFDGQDRPWLAFGEAGAARGGLGLVRLDAQGHVVATLRAPVLPSNRVLALAAGRGGTLWAATASGLTRIDGEAVRSWPWP